MKQFEEILNGELEIAGRTERDELGDVVNPVKRAAIRFANQQTQELEAKILHYRREYVPGHEVGWYDDFFGITSETRGLSTDLD